MEPNARIRRNARRLSDKVADLESKHDAVVKRVSKKNFYQGAAWGAGIASVLFIIGILIF